MPVHGIDTIVSQVGELSLELGLVARHLEQSHDPVAARDAERARLMLDGCMPRLASIVGTTRLDRSALAKELQQLREAIHEARALVARSLALVSDSALAMRTSEAIVARAHELTGRNGDDRRSRAALGRRARRSDDDASD